MCEVRRASGAYRRLPLCDLEHLHRLRDEKLEGATDDEPREGDVSDILAHIPKQPWEWKGTVKEFFEDAADRVPTEDCPRCDGSDPDGICRHQEASMIQEQGGKR